MEKIKALAQFLELNEDEIDDLELVREDCFQIGDKEYLVLTNDEADMICKDCIEESLWAFRPVFLSEYTNLPEEVFIALQEMYENGNDTVKKLIEKFGGLEKFVRQSIQIDGRGHFMNTYDGDEHEFNSGEYYIYRVN